MCIAQLITNALCAGPSCGMAKKKRGFQGRSSDTTMTRPLQNNRISKRKQWTDQQMLDGWTMPQPIASVPMQLLSSVVYIILLYIKSD